MAVTLEWNNGQSVFQITGELIEKLEELLQFAAESEQITSGEVALSFVDDETIHRLNKEYRGVDRPTDVLSFAMRETTEDEMEIIFDRADEADSDADLSDPLGDVIISIPRAIEQSEDYGHSIERELGFLFVHGFLHLLGYDHQDEASEQLMFEKQEGILQKAGLKR